MRGPPGGPDENKGGRSGGHPGAGGSRYPPLTTVRAAVLGGTGMKRVDSEVGDLTAERLTCGVVDDGVLAGEDAAEARLISSRLQRGEAAADAGHPVRGHGDRLPRSEEVGEDRGGGFTDRAVCSRVRRICRRDRDRVPVRCLRVESDARVVAGVPLLDGGDRSPEL